MRSKAAKPTTSRISSKKLAAPDLLARPIPRRHDGWALVLLAVLAVAFLGDTLFQGKILCMRDPMMEHVPMRQSAMQALFEGHFPLWNSYANCGEPFASEFVFYPLYIPFGISPVAVVLSLTILLHLWIAGAAYYLLARHWKLSVAPALLAAICFMFGTFQVSLYEQFPILATVAWSPLALLLLSRLIEQMRSFDPLLSIKHRAIQCIPGIGLLGIVLTLEFLAGYPQFFLYSSMLLGAYAVARPAAYGSLKLTLGSLVVLGLGMALMMGFILPQFLLIWEQIPLSVRAIDIDPGLDMGSLHPKYLLTAFFPFLTGHPGYPDRWWNNTIFEFWISTFYVGAIPLVMAAFSHLCLKNRFRDQASYRFVFLFLIGVTLFSILMAMGKFTPIFLFFHKYIPMFNKLRWPSKFLYLVTLSLPMLAGIGYQMILRLRADGAQKKPRRVFVTLGVAWAGMIALALSLPHAREVVNSFVPAGVNVSALRLEDAADDYFWAVLWLAAGLVVVTFLVLVRNDYRVGYALALGITYANLWFVGKQILFVGDGDAYDRVPSAIASLPPNSCEYRVHSNYSMAQQWLYGSKDMKAFRWAREACVGETWLPFRVFKTYGCGTLKLAGVTEYYNSIWSLPKEQANKLADLLSTRYVLAGAPFEQILWGNASHEVQIMQRPSPLPRAIVVGQVHNVPKWEDAFHAILDSRFNIRNEATVEMAPEQFRLKVKQIPTLEQAAHAPAGRMNSIRHDWNRIWLDVTADQPALVMLNEAWYPGWKATVDGTPQEILKADGVFQGLWVESGNHKIELTYDPPLFKLGLCGAGATTLLLAGMFGVWLRSRKSRTAGDAADCGRSKGSTARRQ